MRPSREQLVRWYVQENLSDREIGLRCGVSDVCVSQWRKREGIATLTAAGKRAARGELSLEDLDEPTLRRLYSVEHRTRAQVAKLYGCSTYPIQQKLDQYGIPAVQKWERHGLRELSSDLLQVVHGTLLGDSTIGFSTTKTSSRLKVSHSHKQYGYLLQLHRRLGAWARPVRASVSLDDKGRRRIGYSFSTVSHPVFRGLRTKFYRDDMKGKVPDNWLKAPPLSVFEGLSDEALAYWYFDDGSFGGDSLSIVVFFPLLDVEDVGAALRRGTGLPWSISSESKDCPHLYDLTLPASAWPDFFDRVAPYATPDVAYKLDRAWHSRIPGQVLVPPDVGSLSVERLDHYPVGRWAQLDSETQERWVREVFLIYRSVGFPFPPELPDNEVLARIQALSEHHEIVPDGHSFRRSGVGLSVCNGFMPHRYSTQVRGRSAWGTFNDDEAFLRVIRTQFKARSSKWVTPVHMRAALSIYGGNRTPSNFRPSVAKAITDALCPVGGTVWDPCAGFGGRLLGVVCSQQNARYLGTEPSPDTVRGLRRLWAMILRVRGGDVSRVQILEGGAEKDCPSDGTVDLVLTSPPYFQTEQYQGGPQSHLEYPSYAEWREGFLTLMVRNAYRTLKSGGHMTINIQNVKRGSTVYPLVSDLDTISRKEGFRRRVRWWYPLNRIGAQRPDEPILVYVKGD